MVWRAFLVRFPQLRLLNGASLEIVQLLVEMFWVEIPNALVLDFSLFVLLEQNDFSTLQYLMS